MMWSLQQLSCDNPSSQNSHEVIKSRFLNSFLQIAHTSLGKDSVDNGFNQPSLQRTSVNDNYQPNLSFKNYQ